MGAEDDLPPGYEWDDDLPDEDDKPELREVSEVEDAKHRHPSTGVGADLVMPEEPPELPTDRLQN